MKKNKFTLPVQKWGTIKSKYQPESNYVSPDEFTVGSNNFITNVTGAIEKRPTDAQFNSTSLSAPGRDAYEAIFANGIHQLLFMDNGTMKYITGPTGMTTLASGFVPTASMEYVEYQNRIYFDNGIDSPGVYDITTSYGGVSYSPQVRNMGAQPPAVIPKVSFAADSAGGSVPVGGHTYRVTFLYYGFEESNGGATSNLRTVSSPNQTVHLITVPIGGYGVTARNIYRDNGDGNYLLVGTIDNNTVTTFVDSVSAGTTPIPVANNLPPTFTYLVLNLSRLWVAGVFGTPTTLYWSLPGLPDIFDPTNFLVCNPKDPITGLAVYQGTVYVFNRHSFGQILGNTDDTFYYQEIPGSIGCTDNRSIQIRTINGVPILVWLSDRGLYAFNGSSVEYISDAIEDEININIQQSNFSTGSNSQSTQADFQGGTSSSSIDLASLPGTITTINPTEIYQSQSDWEGGLTLLNAATKDGLNRLRPISTFGPTYASGTLGGAAIISSGNLTFPVSSQFFGETSTQIGDVTYGSIHAAPAFTYDYATTFAVPIIPDRTGTLTQIKCGIEMFDFNAGHRTLTTYNVSIQTNAFGQPSGVTVTGGTGTIASSRVDISTWEQTSSALSAVLTGGTTYWIVITASGSDFMSKWRAGTPLSGGASLFKRTAGIWESVVGDYFSPSGGGLVLGFYHTDLRLSYTFTYTPVSDSGSWLSPIFDSASTSMQNALFNLSKSFSGSVGSGTLTVAATNDPSFFSGITSVLYTDIAWGTGVSVAIANLRYWRLSITIATTDDSYSLIVYPVSLNFSSVATWISQVIDMTVDATALDQLIMVSSGPGNAVTIATSADGISFSSFVPLGSATFQRYAKIRAITGPMVNAAYITSVTFSWLLTATFLSSVINVGQTPAGWGVFQDSSTQNGGTLHFYMRSAATAGSLTSAIFYEVFNGVLPNVNIIPLQYTQWKIIFTSSANAVPTADSITTNWYIGTQVSPIRVTSLFYNKTYYLAAAELGQTSNNIVIVWDQEGNWRLFRGWNINSLSLFSNLPYFLDAIRTYIYSWLVAIPTNGSGSAITMDVRTKAFDAQDYQHLKSPRSLEVTGINTGTTIHAYYSLDRGTSWIEMLNTNGTLGYMTTTDGSKFYQYFVPDYNLGNAVSGITIMFKVTSTDAFPCKILNIDPELIVRAGKYLGMPI